MSLSPEPRRFYSEKPYTEKVQSEFCRPKKPYTEKNYLKKKKKTQKQKTPNLTALRRLP